MSELFDDLMSKNIDRVFKVEIVRKEKIEIYIGMEPGFEADFHEIISENLEDIEEDWKYNNGSRYKIKNIIEIENLDGIEKDQHLYGWDRYCSSDTIWEVAKDKSAILTLKKQFPDFEIPKKCPNCEAPYFGIWMGRDNTNCWLKCGECDGPLTEECEIEVSD